jgi:cell division protein FtsZ
MNPSHSAIKVIGVGGAGGNAVDRMMRVHLKGVELIALNTDLQDLKKVSAHRKLHIGRDVTHGLGAGMNPELGKKAALESKEDIAHLLEGAEMVFIAAGLGGGTGGGAIQVVADIAKSRGMLTIAVVTTPFAFEGSWRGRLAEKALEDLQGRVDTLLVISNDQMLRSLDADTTVAGARNFRCYFFTRDHQCGFCGCKKHYEERGSGSIWSRHGKRREQD